ncbi:MAG TPA: hypothetical protein VF040_01630 [Ktedonobacterales bacterium]
MATAATASTGTPATEIVSGITIVISVAVVTKAVARGNCAWARKH